MVPWIDFSELVPALCLEIFHRVTDLCMCVHIVGQIVFFQKIFISPPPTKGFFGLNSPPPPIPPPWKFQFSFILSFKKFGFSQKSCKLIWSELTNDTFICFCFVSLCTKYCFHFSMKESINFYYNARLFERNWLITGRGVNQGLWISLFPYPSLLSPLSLSHSFLSSSRLFPLLLSQNIIHNIVKIF